MALATPHGNNQCTAKSKRTGERCKQTAMHGSNVCYMHGGKSPKGIASATYKHGRYSRYTRANIAEKLDRLLADPDILQLHDEIRLVTLRIDEKLDRLETVDAKAIMQELLTLSDKINNGLHNQDFVKVDEANQHMRDILVSRIRSHDVDEDIRRDMEQRRKLIETQRKLNADAEQMITADQAWGIVQRLLNAVKENVTDRKALQAIQNEFVLSVSQSHSQRIDARAESD